MGDRSLLSFAARLAQQPRAWLIPALAGAVLALFILAAGIGQLDMRPNPIYLPTPQEIESEAGSRTLTLLDPEVVERLFLIFLMICTPLVVLAFLFSLLNSTARKVMLKDALTKVAYVLVIFFLFTSTVTLIASDPLDMTGEAFQGPDMPRWSPAEQVPPWMSFAVAVFVLLVISTIGWLVWLRLRPGPQTDEPDNTLKKLELEALASLEDLRLGGDLRNVIMRCYYDMGIIIGEKRGAKRAEWMTPREFEGSLFALGLPRQPVVDLTRLFEEVRYGAAQPSRKEEHRAVQCLTAIVDAIGGRA